MRKIVIALICIGIIFLFFTFENEIIHNYSNLENSQIIYGKDIPSNVSFHAIPYLTRHNSSKLEVRSYIELTISPSSQKSLELYGKKILIVKNVKESNASRISLIYPKRVVIENITAKGCFIKNVSIVTMSQANILLLGLKIPEDKIGNITIEYHAEVMRFEPFVSYIEMRESWSIFRTTYDGNEVVLSSMWLLKELETFESYESQIRLKIPKGWEGIVIDEKGEGFWENIYEGSTKEENVFVYSSKNSRNPLIIVGNFSLIRKNLSGIAIDVYQVGRKREDVLYVASKVVRSYSRILGGYPYSSLKIFYPKSLNTKAGFEFPQGVILIHPERNETLLLAHEIAHVWFGGYASFGRMGETLANYLAITCTNSYEIFNFVEHSPLINSTYTLAQVYMENIFNSHAEGIVYYKGAFVFRSFQFTLGNETFFNGLRELLRECHGKECNLTDVQNVFEKVSGQDLDWFFKEWFYSSKVPDYDVRSLSLEEKNGKYLLTFEIIDKNNFTMPLEVEVITSKEKLVKKVWIKGKARVSFELNDKPLKIILDPNEWMVNENKEYTTEGIKITVE